MAISHARQFLGTASALVPFLEDGEVTDILVNGTHSLYLERNGALESLPSPFFDHSSLFDFIERLLVPLGKRVDAAQPYVDGRLLDGSRFHIILPPIAVEGPLISIRKFSRSRDVARKPIAPPHILEWLREQVCDRRNILIAGGTGVGKTTLLSDLLELVSPGERITIVEETLEIQTGHPHALHLEARAPSPDGLGEVTLRSLIRNALRMRPDRLVLGECRGAEAFDMLQAMNTGHPGSLCTVHASGALNALKRLEALSLLAGFALPISTLREWIGSAVQVVVHLERAQGQRRISEILCVQGLEGDVYRILPKYQLRAGVW